MWILGLVSAVVCIYTINVIEMANLVDTERSRQNYASEQKRMQEDTKRERIAILACFEDQLGNRLVN